MPDRTISLLGATVAVLVTVYIGLVVTTITFATMQTELALTARDAESAIGAIETAYYAQVGVLSATDPKSMDLHKPSAVHYATKVTAPSLSLR